MQYKIELEDLIVFKKKIAITTLEKSKDVMCVLDQGCVGCVLKGINALKVECKLNLRLERKKQSLVNLIKYVLFQSSSPQGRFTGGFGTGNAEMSWYVCLRQEW